MVHRGDYKSFFSLKIEKVVWIEICREVCSGDGSRLVGVEW